MRYISTDYVTERRLDRHRSRIDIRTGDRHKGKGDRHTDLHRKSLPRGLTQKFVAIDGEAFENGYCLLDSSVESYPRLYSPEPLTCEQIMDWLWGLASLPECTDVDFILYGADYDFNNWLHNVLHLNHSIAETNCHDHSCLCRLCDGDYVKTGTPYVVKWQRGYRFVIRKYDGTVKRPGGQRREVTFWDVLPLFQKSFINALGLYETEVPQIIEDGKDARGTFLHSQLEWVSQYNKLECTLLIDLMNRVTKSFDTIGLSLAAWNGPGAAAKALLKREGVIEHNGRERNGRKVGKYTCPPEVQEAMWSAYGGGMMRVRQLGYTYHAFQYDIQSAYPYQMCMLPCLTHGHWVRERNFVRNGRGKFGLWLIRYTNLEYPSIDYLEPFFARMGEKQEYLTCVERWAYGNEIEAWIKWHEHNRDKNIHIVFLDGWYWVPERCEKPMPFQWVHKEAMTRLAFKKSGQNGPALVLKLGLNSIYGSLAQSKGTIIEEDPPWSQQMLWAGWITAGTRAQLWSAAMEEPSSVIHLATDGIICTEPLTVRCSDRLGDWEVKDLHNLTVFGFGQYIHDDGMKSRGFVPPGKGEPTADLVSRIHHTWDNNRSRYNTIDCEVRGFVGAHQVRAGVYPVEDWCRWVTEYKIIDVVYADQRFEELTERPHSDRLTHIRTSLQARATIDGHLGTRQPFPSTPYKPQITKRYDWPRDALITSESM